MGRLPEFVTEDNYDYYVRLINGGSAIDLYRANASGDAFYFTDRPKQREDLGLYERISTADIDNIANWRPMHCSIEAELSRYSPSALGAPRRGVAVSMFKIAKKDFFLYWKMLT